MTIDITALDQLPEADPAAPADPDQPGLAICLVTCTKTCVVTCFVTDW